MGIETRVQWALLVCICLLNATNVISASNDDELLQQALFLVDLLKAEYSRVQKENIVLRQRLITYRQIETQHNSANDAEWQNVDDSNIHHHRHVYGLTRVPISYRRTYGHNSNIRQFNYEEAFGEHPNSTLSTTVSTSTQTTVTTTTAASVATSVTTLTAKTSLQDVSSTKRKIIKLKHEKSKNATNASITIKAAAANTATTKTKSGNTISRDPVREQVASAIINEVKDVSPKMRLRKDKRFGDFTRGTLRIHLASSTRYPIPLPENHAFCFFHPESALCRTFI